MGAQMVFIESEGLLYRGPSVHEPLEIWHYPHKVWVPFCYYEGPVDDDWGKEIDASRAEALKVDNWNAENFSYYDIPPWLQFSASR